MRTVDINCDLGESFGHYQLGDDRAMMPSITSANVACGLHAGDPLVMQATVKLCLEHRVALGAHPGYPDLLGFGRRQLAASPEEVRAYVLYQLGALAAFLQAAGGRLQHVKAHGALYNAAALDQGLAEAIASAVAAFDSGLILVGPPHSCLIAAGRAQGLPVASEVFADRAYAPDGTLVPRGQSGAVLTDVEEVVKRINDLTIHGGLEAVDGTFLPLAADTICVHGDTPGAAHFAATLKGELERSGMQLRAMGQGSL